MREKDRSYDEAATAWEHFKKGDYLNAERHYLIAAQYASVDPSMKLRTKQWDTAAARCRKLRLDRKLG